MVPQILSIVPKVLLWLVDSVEVGTETHSSSLAALHRLSVWPDQTMLFPHKPEVEIPYIHISYITYSVTFPFQSVLSG